MAKRVKDTSGRISAKRLLPAVGRRVISGRRGTPAVWSPTPNGSGAKTTLGVVVRGCGRPGETLIIDWGVLDGVHVFCAVLAWSRFRFVQFAADAKSSTTLGFLAECFEVLGGVPKGRAG